MTHVLVIDDSAVDRQLVKSLLSRSLDCTTEEATNGEEGLEVLAQRRADLVITDLIMPRMGGLEVVEAIKQRYPLVPVILMTSKGNEEIAVEALKNGASSYVPKRSLAVDLIETVQGVLSVSRHERSHERMVGSMTRMDCAFSLENDARLVHPLITYLQEQAERLGLCSEKQLTRLGVALEEALLNAVYHGNLEVDSELREVDDRAYYALVNERRQQSPYQERRVEVVVQLTREKAVFTIRDEGPGFDVSKTRGPIVPVSFERVSGRGLILMRTFMDDVRYNDIGNEVVLTKFADPIGVDVELVEAAEH